MKLLLCLLWAFLISLLGTAQTNDVEFVIQKIRSEYPGFKEKISDYAYLSACNRITRLNGNDTFRILASIAYLFNDQHLRVVGRNDWHPNDSITCRRNRQNVIAYFNRKRKLKKYEGFWLSDGNDCIVALKYDSGRHYTLWAIEVSGGDLIPGQVKGTIKWAKDGRCYSDSYVTYSGKRAMLSVVFRSDTVFTVGGSNKWKRQRSYRYGLLSSLPEISERVDGKLLDSNTYMLRVPGCSSDNVAQLDSIVKADLRIITSTKRLIIDVRNNAGGSSDIYNALVPLAYSHPYARISSCVYCTEGNIHQYQKILDSYRQNGIDSETENAWMNYLKMMRDSIGKLVCTSQYKVQYDSVLKYPEKIAVIINYATQSAAEMLAITCMNSSKTTIFGENSGGAVDYLSYYSINCPSGKYELYMPTSKRFIAPGEVPLDGKGITPNVVISDSVSDWVQFIQHYYENN